MKVRLVSLILAALILIAQSVTARADEEDAGKARDALSAIIAAALVQQAGAPIGVPAFSRTLRTNASPPNLA
jgi:hypothetical protein